VARGEELDYFDGNFSVCLSCECFEHNPEWAATLRNMIRMCSGLVFFSCATTGRAEHGTRRSNPHDAPFCGDYYRNLTEDDVRQECRFIVLLKSMSSVSNDCAGLILLGAEMKEGLYANIHQKRARIKAGSNERMRKPGSKGAPTREAFVKSAKTARKTSR
jgi:hypothetical protein